MTLSFFQYLRLKKNGEENDVYSRNNSRNCRLWRYIYSRETPVSNLFEYFPLHTQWRQGHGLKGYCRKSFCILIHSNFPKALFPLCQVLVQETTKSSLNISLRLSESFKAISSPCIYWALSPRTPTQFSFYPDLKLASSHPLLTCLPHSLQQAFTLTVPPAWNSFTYSEAQLSLCSSVTPSPAASYSHWSFFTWVRSHCEFNITVVSI